MKTQSFNHVSTIFRTLVLLALSLGSFQVAHAGYWQVSYETNVSWNSYTWPSTPGYWETRHGYVLYEGLYNPAEELEISDVYVGGTIKPVLTWVPSPQNDLPPTSISLVEHAGATASSIFLNTGVPEYASNGFDDAVQIVNTPENGGGRKLFCPGSQGGGFASHISIIDNPNRLTVVRGQSRLLKAKVDWNESHWLYDAYCAIRYKATVDNRAVKITRDGSMGDTPERVVDGRWVKRGHTVFSRGSASIPADWSDPIDWNVQNFQAHITNPSAVPITSVRWSHTNTPGIVNIDFDMTLGSGGAFYGTFPTGFESRPGYPQLPADNGTQLPVNNIASAAFIVAPKQYELAASTFASGSDELKPFWPLDSETVLCTVTFADGAKAEGAYEIGVHTEYAIPLFPPSSVLPMSFTTNMVNVRPHPNAQVKVATSDNETLIADATQAYSWIVRPEYFSVPNTLASRMLLVTAAQRDAGC